MKAVGSILLKGMRYWQYESFEEAKADLLKRGKDKIPVGWRYRLVNRQTGEVLEISNPQLPLTNFFEELKDDKV